MRELTADELNFGLVKRYKTRYLLIKYSKIRPNNANMAKIGCNGKKNDVKNAVLII